MSPTSPGHLASHIVRAFACLLLVILVAAGSDPARASAHDSNPEAETPPDRLLEPHPSYSVEWWYITGHLRLSGSSKPYGFEGTFFRFSTGYRHPTGLPDSPWEPDTVLSFHGAVSDLSGKRFFFRETLGRCFRKSASVQNRPFIISLNGNRLKYTGTGRHFSLHLTEGVSDVLLDLDLEGNGPPLWQAPSGALKTGPGAGDRAYYYSYPALKVSGRIGRVGPEGGVDWKSLTGKAWLDHEWTRQMMGAKQTGWIWLGARLPEHGALMAFQMEEHGRPDAFRGGTYRNGKTGNVRWLGPSDVSIAPIRYWKSPKTGICYPSILRISAGLSGPDFIVRPDLDDQELKGSLPYWEGAVRLEDPLTKASRGEGYLELTGFDKVEPGKCPG